jgi:hypothetical protein
VTVGELVELLEGFDPDAEIRIASQPRAPVAYEIEAVVDGGNIPEEPVDEAAEIEGEPGLVYVLEGTQIGHAPKEIWELF